MSAAVTTVMPQSYEITLVASTVATQTVTAPSSRIEVVNTDGLGAVDFILVSVGDAADPTEGGDHQWKLPAAVSSRVIQGHGNKDADLKFISPAAVTLTITVLDS